MATNSHPLTTHQSNRAQRNYDERFDQGLYDTAAHGRSSAYCVALIDEALALCGSPFYRVSNRKWGQAALDFLRRFDA